jgi:hypothetical protein
VNLPENINSIRIPKEEKSVYHQDKKNWPHKRFQSNDENMSESWKCSNVAPKFSTEGRKWINRFTRRSHEKRWDRRWPTLGTDSSSTYLHGDLLPTVPIADSVTQEISPNILKGKE